MAGSFLLHVEYFCFTFVTFLVTHGFRRYKIA